MKEFFDNRNLIVIIDEMCRKYGKLPHEVMFETTIHEFCFDAAIMVMGNIEEEKRLKGQKPSDKVNWGSMGIDRKVVKKNKGGE